MTLHKQIKATIPGTFYMFAGSLDSQTSADISDVDTFELPDPNGKAGGACTSALLQTLYRDGGDEQIQYTWSETLEIMTEKIEDIGLTQRPQLSSSRPINVDELICIVPPECTGTKRALLVGINYVGDPHALSGCQNDVRNMKDFLMNVHGFERENMLILLDDKRHHFPTKKLILDGFRKLAEISQPGDCIFVQFSGHGSQMQDRSNEEKDGFDETLIPYDFREAGPILDDEIYSYFVTQVQAGVHVVAVIDCCHSGTALDLPYIFTPGDSEIHFNEGFRMPLIEKVRGKKDKKKKKKGTKKKKKMEEQDEKDE